MIEFMQENITELEKLNLSSVDKNNLIKEMKEMTIEIFNSDWEYNADSYNTFKYGERLVIYLFKNFNQTFDF